MKRDVLRRIDQSKSPKANAIGNRLGSDRYFTEHLLLRLPQNSGNSEVASNSKGEKSALN